MRSLAQMELPLTGVRVADLTWLVSGAWGTRQLAALGAEVIRVEWESQLDAGRYDVSLHLPGEEPGTSPSEGRRSLNRSGRFNNTNAGKLGISLNLKHPQGKEAFRRLVAASDVVIENFTAGTLTGLGFGYEALRKIREDIIYVQLPGYGADGPYVDYRAYGLINQAFSGLTNQSGIPEPAQPCGWGYGYMDTMVGVFNSTAVVSALLYRDRTGKGQHIDMAQTEVGILITGPAYLDRQVNGRGFRRSGNRSPYLPAAPHGVYRCAGDDAWVAVACYTEEEWRALCVAFGDPPWSQDPRFATLDSRLRHQIELDRCVERWTRLHGKHEVMHLLQKAGVRAGAVQTAEDIIDHDPSLAARDYLAWVRHSEAGMWPVERGAGLMSETPMRAGGAGKRGAPCYGEDAERVLHSILGYSEEEIAALRDAGAI